MEVIIHPLSDVLFCPRDINLQDKADYARLLFIKPPEIKVEQFSIEGGE